MSDSIKFEIKTYISVQSFSFWVSFLKGWTIFDLFAFHWPLGCPKTDQKMSFDKNKLHDHIPHSELCIYVKFQLLGIILLENGEFETPFDSLLIPGVYKITFAWATALAIKQFWKIILRSIKNCWETNFSKIIQKVLVLDLS